MKLPNGCGSVIRLGRHRRKQFAARVTVGRTDDGKQIKKYLGTFQTRQEALNALANYNQNPFDVDLRKLTFAGLCKRHIQVADAIDKQTVTTNYASLVELPTYTCPKDTCRAG